MMIRIDQDRRIFPLVFAYHACRSFVRNRGGVVARVRTESRQKANANTKQTDRKQKAKQKANKQLTNR